MKTKTLVMIFVLVIVGLIVFNSVKSEAPGEYDEFAQCLTDAGLKMYGTEWCPHCKAQKELFGNSFKNVDYIDCDRNRETCLIEGVKGYPTWKINGESVSGTQPLESLAGLTDCELIKNG